MTILNENDSLVLIIDIQEKLLRAAYNSEQIEKKACVIAKSAKILNIPVIITEQYPKGLGKTVESIKNVLNNYGSTFEKTSFSAIDNPEILDAIIKTNKKQIIVLGIETHICVSQTVNSLIQKGFEVSVLSDASGSRFDSEHIRGLERIKNNGGSIITTEIAIFEWLKSSKHPKFKEVQALIK